MRWFELVNTAHATGVLPTRGGLPVSGKVTLDRNSPDHQLLTTSRGHRLTPSEARFVGCDAAVTPVLIEYQDPSGSDSWPDTVEERLRTTGGSGHESVAEQGAGTSTEQGDGTSMHQRLAALAVTLMGQQVPLAVGRTGRTATPAQRRALAVRDGGCVIPGCAVVAEACQVHHLTEWAAGGASDPDNLVLLCWSHHRQVDLRMWSIEPAGGGAAPLDGRASPDERGPAGAVSSGNNGSPWVVRALPRSRWRP